MRNFDYLKDADFLRLLDNEVNKFYWVKIEVLDADELPIQSIEGKVMPGSTISIDGDSAIRRTCNITFVAEDDYNDLTDINNLLSINKKIKIYTGINNDIDSRYDKIIWFPQGVFVITQPSINHSSSGCTITLSCKDKMCLLNGECGGGFPTSVTFHEYTQIIGERDCGSDDPAVIITDPNDYTVYSYTSNGIKKYKMWKKIQGWNNVTASMIGQLIDIPQLFYDIIQTLVCNYGGEALSKIFINDVPLEIKQLVRYTGSKPLYYNIATGIYTTNADYVAADGTTNWKVFNYNEDVGYVYTDFVYPGELISNIGENVCTILDKIKTTLGNYEYFYDIEGNFVFQEKKNYLKNSYDPVNRYRLDNNRKVTVPAENGLAVIDDTNYKVDFCSNDKNAYVFTEGNGLVASYVNTPIYSNLKNDFHIWGTNENKNAIHYHFAIKKKPKVFNEYSVVYIIENGKYTGGLRLACPSDPVADIQTYVPADWRAELYLSGLTKQSLGQRPDIYEQELLDLFDGIYDFKEKKFKADMVYRPNDLTYFFDYLEPVDKLYDYSVDALKTKMFSYKQDKVIKLYNNDVPNQIIIGLNVDPITRANVIERCEREGQSYVNVNSEINNHLAIGTIGYSAQEVGQNLLYQYTNYNESITIQCIPIFYLEPNRRISVYDQKSGIAGDYVIKSISMPVGGTSLMSITAIKDNVTA